MKLINALSHGVAMLLIFSSFAFAQADFTHKKKSSQTTNEDNRRPNPNDKRFVEQLKNSASPIINGGWATFVYRGTGRDIELVGEMTDWRPRGLKFAPLAGTGIKYYSIQFPVDARIEYKLIVDNKWILDPLNPNKKENGIGG